MHYGSRSVAAPLSVVIIAWMIPVRTDAGACGPPGDPCSVASDWCTTACTCTDDTCCDPAGASATSPTECCEGVSFRGRAHERGYSLFGPTSHPAVASTRPPPFRNERGTPS